MKTPGGLVRKQVYLPEEVARALSREVERRRSMGEESSESAVIKRAIEMTLKSMNSRVLTPAGPST